MNTFSPASPSLLPVVVKNLLIINGLFFLATFSLQSLRIDLLDLLGLHYFGASKFRPIQFLTYMFLHANMAHIFFNMFALWMFGKELENLWGPKRFLGYYLATGIGASLIHYGVLYFELAPTLAQLDQLVREPDLTAFADFMAANPPASQEMINNHNQFVNTSGYNDLLASRPDLALEKAVDYMLVYREGLLNAPMVVGASGAVFGLLLAFGMSFPNAMIYVFFAIPMKAKWFVVIYGVFELYNGVAGTADGVAHFAHLGGMLFGLGLILWWRRFPSKNR